MFSRLNANRRKHHYIDKKQQNRFALEVALHALLFPVLFLVLTMVSTTSALLVGEQWENVQPLLNNFLGFSLTHWWVIVLALANVAYASILFSHRIFGPVCRLEQALMERKLNPEEPVRCGLRKGDYLHEFSALLEEVLNDGEAVRDMQKVSAPRQLEVESEKLTASPVA